MLDIANVWRSPVLGMTDDDLRTLHNNWRKMQSLLQLQVYIHAYTVHSIILQHINFNNNSIIILFL